MNLPLQSQTVDTETEKRPKRTTIRFRLTYLVYACVVPVFLVVSLFVAYTYINKRALIENHMLETARALTLAVDRDLAHIQSALQVLATSPYLAEGNLRGFHGQAREILRHFPGADIILADETGQQQVNSYRDFGTALPKRGNLTVVRKIFETGTPVVSDLFLGAVTKRPLIGVDVPVIVDGKVIYDLAMTLPAERLAASLSQQHLAPGWVGSLLDPSHVIAARTVTPEVFVGRKIGAALLAHLTGASEGVVVVNNIEGSPVIDAFSQSTVSGWTVVVGVPAVIVQMELWQWLGLTIAGIVTVMAASVGLAGWMADGIARSIQALVAPAMAVGRGAPVEAACFDLQETSDVGEALAKASNLLVLRAQERDGAEQALTERTLQLQRQYETLRALNEIAALSEADEGRQMVEALVLGLRHLGLSIGIISQIEGERYTVRYHSAPPEFALKDGDIFDLGKTYCVMTLAAKDVVAISHMARSENAGHPCYQAFGLETYIGAPLIVHGQVYGAVNFSSPAPRAQPFNSGDLEFMRLLARWIGAVLEREFVHGELARSNTELEQFAYVASHDLRAPLRQVSSFMTLLERQYGSGLDAEAREYIGFARDGARRMDQLIVDLLDYSRIGRHDRPKGAVDLTAVVADALRNLTAVLGEAQVTVADLPTVIGDTIELIRLFQNLIGNAAKYRDPSRPLALSVTAARDGRWWVIAVKDNGIGIAPEHFEAIFRIFQRLHGVGQYEGTGIGLASCKKIAEHHGGRIWLQSTPGEGSEFFVSLPAADGPSA